MLGARELGVDHPGLRALAELVREVAGLFDWSEGVAVAVDDEEGRGFRVDSINRRGATELVGLFALECLRDLFLEAPVPKGEPVGAEAAGEVIDAVDWDCGLQRVSASSKPGWYSGSFAVSAIKAAR